MFNLTALKRVLSAVLSPPYIHTAILFTPSGDLVAHATDVSINSKDHLRVLVGLASEVWFEVGEEGQGMVESELGKILVLPLYHKQPLQTSHSGRSGSQSTDYATATHNTSERDPSLLIAINALDGVEWAEMQIKAQGAVNHLVGPLREFKDRLLSSPPRSRIRERFY